MSVSEKVGRAGWEAARFLEYERGDYAGFSCGIVAQGKRLVGILEVYQGEQTCRGELLIPMRVTENSRVAAQVEQNRGCFSDPGKYGVIARELGLVFGKYYGDLLVTSHIGLVDRLGVEASLNVSNRFSGSAPRAAETGNTGVAMGLAQHIMDSLPGGWQITPEPLKR
ncbi:MAG: hypothetical protein HY381_00340 [Candidatus Chisholmbacteria bacterium]|nr:hypothetical protein [Candidatus Chisholmbacteria bacterium]